jgi:hypothetical protein
MIMSANQIPAPFPASWQPRNSNVHSCPECWMNGGPGPGHRLDPVKDSFGIVREALGSTKKTRKTTTTKGTR